MIMIMVIITGILIKKNCDNKTNHNNDANNYAQ